MIKYSKYHKSRCRNSITAFVFLKARIFKLVLTKTKLVYLIFGSMILKQYLYHQKHTIQLNLKNNGTLSNQSPQTP